MPDEINPSGELSPKDNSYLIGHEDAERLFLRTWQNNSMHNSWLISGIEGIGKATLAYRFARFCSARTILGKILTPRWMFRRLLPFSNSSATIPTRI
ncbi:MAG: hypothetical protein ACLSFR_06305 [Alphaproteobacteria bacterium]